MSMLTEDNKPSKIACDMVIVGAGVVGLTLANLCAQQGLKVGVLEKNAPTLLPDTPSFDLRCFAISKATQSLFASMGVWEIIATNRISPYDRMVVWDALGFGEITFTAEEIAEPHLGFIVENKVLMNALTKITEENENITAFYGCAPKAMQSTETGAMLHLEQDGPTSSMSIFTKLIVGAEGAHSWVREAANIESLTEDYQQQALVATIQTEHPHQHTAWQRFLSRGPLAFLPLPDPHTSSIVWTASSEVTAENLTLSEAQFSDSLSHALDYRLGQAKLISERKTFPLKMQHAKTYIKERVCLVGDAAHMIHPLAGQGLNLGLQDVKALGEVLIDSFKGDRDIGHYLVLRKYERARRGQVSLMINAMKIFKELFGSQKSLITLARSLGLNMTDSTLPFLKKKLMKIATGI